MAQGGHGNVGFFEDFLWQTAAAGVAGSDTVADLHSGVSFCGTSGVVTYTSNLALPNGVCSFSGAGGAADGVAFVSEPMRPDRQGTIMVEARFCLSLLTTWQAFLGFATTVVAAEAVMPFTLSSTTLTANNAGNCVGLYYDTTATVDDWRTMASVAGVAATSALGLNKVALGTLGTRVNAVPVVSSMMYLRVEIDSDGSARTYYGDVSIDANNTGPKLVGAVAAGTLSTTGLYVPVLMLADPSTNDPTWDVDFFGGQAYRDWTY